MDKALRNTLRNVVTKCRKLLEEAIGELLQGQFGIHADGKIEDALHLPHLSAEDLSYREEVLAHLEHIKASGLKPHDATAQLIRETAFTHLNRLCAYKMMTSRGLIEDPVGKGLKSRGFVFYLADHPKDEALFNGAQEDAAYRHYIEWLNESLSSEIEVLFAIEDIASRLFPPFRVLIKVLDLINSQELSAIWAEDETIGWVFQYFTPKELRDQVRRESAAPRNSYEMAFRNQFFTPRYVVELLVDNTLGRTWYEMRQGDTVLAENCRYLAKARDGKDIPHRSKKDPREIKVLDPACGSGHFLLYCFDVLMKIYEEAYSDEELGPKLKESFSNEEEYKRAIADLILSHNLHGIDIDLRVTQLAALALWLRAQRAFQEMGLGAEERPQIKRMNLVCSEPMPGEEDLLEEYIAELTPHPLGALIGDLVRNVFKRMKLAGEAGALVRIEDDISEPLEDARRQWQELTLREEEREGKLAKKGALFDYTKEESQKDLMFDIRDITSESVWQDAERVALRVMRDYARRAGNGKQLLRRLFAEDTEQGFAFIDLCRQKFDVVLMNPPFGDASIPSKPYIDETYGDTKGDVYKAFVECFQDRLVPSGFLGIISSRTGFFLGGSSDWRERIVLRLYRPLVLADFGMGVLDAMVETAGYVLRSLTEEEDRQLTLQLARDLGKVSTDKNDLFSTKKYEVTHNLKRHQANGELRRLYDAGFIKPVQGHFPRWTPLEGDIAKAPAPANAPFPQLICLRLLDEDDKGQALYEVLHNAHDHRLFIVLPEDFREVPNAPFCYWVSTNVRNKFEELSPFEAPDRHIRVGDHPGDGFRYLRLFWEPPASGERDWRTYQKGGDYSPYYYDPHLVADWDEDRQTYRGFYGRPGRQVERPSNYQYFFIPGLTWPRRSQKGLSVRIHPAGCVFADKGPVILTDNSSLLPLLGLTNSIAFRGFISLQMVFGSYEVGVMQRTPVPDLSGTGGKQLGDSAVICVNLKRSLDTSNETSHIFYLPALLQACGDTFAERLADWQKRVKVIDQQLATQQLRIDDTAFDLYGIRNEDRRAIESSINYQPSFDADSKQTETEDDTEDEQESTDQRQLIAAFISYTIGCAFGRWDARFATGERLASELPDPFAPLPICAPGALTGEDGLPLSGAPQGYSLRVDSDGILVDDPMHADDLVARVREVFELVWAKGPEAREREACAPLGVKDLRDYFRKPAAGGFWTDHVKRYSKSRRKAPIYWLLRSSKGKGDAGNVGSTIALSILISPLFLLRRGNHAVIKPGTKIQVFTDEEKRVRVAVN